MYLYEYFYIIAVVHFQPSIVLHNHGIKGMRNKCRYFYLDFVKVKIMEFIRRTDIPRGLIIGLALFGKIHVRLVFSRSPE